MAVPGALLLANPICMARHGVSLDDLQGLMARHGVATEASLLAERPDVLAYQDWLRRSPPPLVIAAGGDGTVHHAANVVAESRVPLGVLPLGTANDFARTLGLPSGLEAAAALIADGGTVAVDLGRVNAHVFLNAAHLGLGVETVKRISPRLKRLIGAAAYAVAAAGAYMAAEPLSIVCCFEGERCVNVRASQLLVGNGRHYGGGMLIAQDASLADGLLDVYILGPDMGPGQAIRLATAARRGHLEDHPHVFHTRVARFSAHLSRPAEVNMDGELVAMDETLAFEVLPRALSVFAPRCRGQRGQSELGGGRLCTEA